MQPVGFKTKAKREEERQAKLPVLAKKGKNEETPEWVELLHFKAKLALVNYLNSNTLNAEPTLMHRLREIKNAMKLFREPLT